MAYYPPCSVATDQLTIPTIILIGGNAARRIIGHGGLKLQIIRECKKLDRMRRAFCIPLII